MSSASVANAADYYTPPQGNAESQVKEQAQQSVQFPGSNQSAPAVKGSNDYQLPEGNQWRYSEFINAVQSGKVERVRFSKEGGQLQVQHVHAFYQSDVSTLSIKISRFLLCTKIPHTEISAHQDSI